MRGVICVLVVEAEGPADVIVITTGDERGSRHVDGRLHSGGALRVAGVLVARLDIGM